MTPGSSTYISALLLAAGMGERMGQAKQLLPLGEQRMIEASLHNLAASCVDEIIVVLGFAADQVIPFVEGKDKVKVVINPCFEAGMSASIHCGLKAMDPRATGILIAMADQPFIPVEVINMLIERFTSSSKGIVLPVYERQQGHPVILSRQAYEKELLALEGDVGGKQIVHDHPEDLSEVAVDARGVVMDIDEPADYQTIQEKT